MSITDKDLVERVDELEKNYKARGVNIVLLSFFIIFLSVSSCMERHRNQDMEHQIDEIRNETVEKPEATDALMNKLTKEGTSNE